MFCGFYKNFIVPPSSEGSKGDVLRFFINPPLIPPSPRGKVNTGGKK
jgi:hypothetical protein